jgi:hypothetical protein
MDQKTEAQVNTCRRPCAFHFRPIIATTLQIGSSGTTKEIYRRLVLCVSGMTTPYYRFHGMSKREKHSALHKEIGKKNPKSAAIANNASRVWISGAKQIRTRVDRRSEY